MVFLAISGNVLASEVKRVNKYKNNYNIEEQENIVLIAQDNSSNSKTIKEVFDHKTGVEIKYEIN